ncbi:hypothetical protein TPELB_23410 [Terrisporobacter petrolearius]|uniref:Uncharacterized protein n=1 Tax=Terrisporobacter petrolearius TaxID=1460447 RepID=A0ABZ3FGD3_9FIRM
MSRLLYNKTNWKDDETTPINARNLNNLEDGIEYVYEKWDEIISDATTGDHAAELIDARNAPGQNNKTLGQRLNNIDEQFNTITQDVNSQLDKKVSIDVVENNNYAIKPLTIFTPDGYNQPYHPSVVYIPEGLNGYKFWMAETPLPIGATLYRDRYECPCIHASNNGIDWVQPNGLANPIDDLTSQEISNEDFFSDVHLIYRDDIKKLECWYRITRKVDKSHLPITLPTWLIRKTSIDGVNWSEREIMSNFNVSSNPLYPMVRSQALIWSGSKYMMWFVDGEVAGLPFSERTIKYSESEDGLTWTPKTKVGLYKGSDAKPVIPWHIDVQYDNGEYRMLVYELAKDNASGIDNLTHFASVDGKNFSYVNTIIKSTTNKVSYYQGLYRSCAVKVGSYWYCYISASNDNRTFLGLMKGTKLSNLKIFDATYNDEKQFFAKGIRMIVDKKYGVYSLELENGMSIKFEDINDMLQTVLTINTNNEVVIGNLTHTGNTIIYGGSNRKINVDTLIPIGDNFQDLGSTTNHFKNLHLKGFVQPGRFTTANRPLNALTGAIIYDVNLGKPIYWDGVSKWKDFNGNIV